MSSPWGKIQQIETPNLQDIMSEQVAVDLQAKEDEKYANFLHQQKGNSNEISENAIEAMPSDEICESDSAIAMMLQKQFDKEYDKMLKRTENKFNGSCKVSVSYSNYRRSDNFSEDSESEDEIIDIVDRKDWDRFDTVERTMSVIPRCGYMKQDGNMITKHDVTLTSRKNACKLMSFPPEFHTGDGAGFDLQLSNKVFNSLKVYSNKEKSRRYKLHDKKEEQATTDLGIDKFTYLLFFKLINEQLLEKVNGIISTGKEAIILHAECDPLYPEKTLPEECVIKVFKTTLNEYKHREKYIRDDLRFKDRYGKQSSRKLIQLWAEKEMHNLKRLKKVGMSCPDVITLKKHILVMSFIGNNHIPAPKLKDANLSTADWIIAYDQVVEALKKLYSEAKLIHADFSEYNILWHDNKCWFIDVSQSVEPIHPNAYRFLLRDCVNISTFFERQGVVEVKDPRELFIDITGFDFYDENSLPTTGIKAKPHLIHKSEMQDASTFEDDWNKSQVTNLISENKNVQLVDTVVA